MISLFLEPSNIKIALAPQRNLNVDVEEVKQTLNIKNQDIKIDVSQQKFNLEILNLQTREIVGEVITPLFLESSDNQIYDEDYFYFGWEDVDGSPLIRRYERGQATFETADIGDLTYAVALENRASLTYN